MATTTRQDKVKATIERVENRIRKLVAMTEAQIIKKYGYKGDAEVPAEKIRKDAYSWYEYDVKQACEQLENNKKKLEEAKRLDEKADARTAKAQQREQTLADAPQALKDFADKLCEEWTKWYIANRKKNQDWRSDETIAEDCRKDADWLILDFMARTEKKCGKLTDTKHLYLNNANFGVCLNGWVEGEKGTARVESIMAGGYNIQCRHIRVLVK